MKKKIGLLASFFLLTLQIAKAQNLLNNGDFESGGNGVGFNINSSFYNNINPPYSGNTSPGNYSVTTNPQPMNTAFFISGGDHTTGTGHMLVVDGTTTGGQQRFWRAGNNGGGVCNLTVGTNYTFHYWIKSVSTQVTNSSNQANIGYQIIGASNITLISGNATAPLPAEGWQEVVYTFTATNNCVNIELWDNNTTAIGNDFAVDDFALFGPPAPFNLEYSTINPSCVGAADGSIIGYGSGANPPYYYWITGTVSANNGTGIFTGLPAGTYSLNILEGADGEIHINDIVLSEPQDLTISSPTTICQNESATISVSGSNSGYQWTSNPSDNNLNPTAASQQVSPAVSTTYTVTSNVGSNRNLIFNHDFSQGDKGFVTDYIYYSPNNPNGNQRAYGIVSNPQNWESGFASFTDHSGNGLMLVVDGSPQNSGNDKVWSQSVPVTPNQNYTFSYWVRTAALPSLANLEVIINGNSVGIDAAPINTLSWVNHTYTWNSGSNTVANIILYDRNTVLTGNDFALDDLSFIGPTTQCVLTKSVTVTVNNSIVPNFPTSLAICSGANVPTLVNTSPNGITGTWSPAVVSNTTSAIYTFTPNVGQCASAVQFSVNVNSGNVVPTFPQIGPFCSGVIMTDPPLPQISSNGITGQWTPNFNNTQTTTYTFTPDAGQCASSTTLEVVINPSVTPAFSQVGPFCAGENISDPLPLLSENGILGHWTPVFNNNQTTTYTFIPNVGQCATTTTLEIIINQKRTPTFNPVGPYCSGQILNNPLPDTSIEGIAGSWAPAFNNTATTTYTFTPNDGQCANTTTAEVVIVENNIIPIFSFDPYTTACYRPIDEVPPAILPNISDNGIYGSWSPAYINYSTLGETVYTFTPLVNTCASNFTFTVNVIDVPDFVVNSDCVNEKLVLSVTLFEVVEDSHFTWYNAQNEIISTESSVIITEKGTYKVVKEINGCTKEQTVIVSSVNCMIPKGISPNDDTLNDAFDLSNLDVKRLEIFNRYGTEVYSKSNYKKEWTGKDYNDHYLPDGTYFYVIDFNSGKSKTGWVYLIREH
ncbi:MAG: gliding motility-associated C-terminal domain-containing protein [Bacteroidetes bacterium]|nr:gliding motility-associated C-terminal domain-containing protein [Bacteroidota bacterium]